MTQQRLWQTQLAEHLNSHLLDSSTCQMEPPKLESEADMKALIGKYILHAFQLENAMGWFLGKVVAVGVSNRDLKKTPTAIHVVLYEMKHTKNKHLVGRVASTLSSAKYGVNEWWVLLLQQSG
ncbi:hypothetical protein AB1Y20_003125 [Prymnesium parvum]|uniref:Uncharacterized protein n=1 Tax=Prymnesium parvum TaxID=97485 RepID=A0AB34JCR7_PRYPA